VTTPLRAREIATTSAKYFLTAKKEKTKMYPFREMLLKFFYRVSTPFFLGGTKKFGKI
jgi:hypothetical protein